MCRSCFKIIKEGLSFALVPSKEDYFFSTSNNQVPKPSVFKVEPVPQHEIKASDNKGVLADVGKFVKTSIDKGVQAIKDLVNPSSQDEAYIAPEVYSIDDPSLYTTPGQSFVPAPPSNYLAPDSKWKRVQEVTSRPKAVVKQTEKKKEKKPSLKSTFAPTKDEIQKRPIVFFDITIDGVPAGTIFFELFNETVPKTAENFRALTTGERGFGYKNSVFHRIVPGYIVQGGDFTSRDGNGQMSIYGRGLFEDENFLVPHDSPGMLSMANEGPDSNGSQFFITVTKLSKLNGKHVVFGRVHDETSYQLIEKINKECGREDGKPLKVVEIINTGQYR